MVDGLTPSFDFDPSKPAAQKYVKGARSKAQPTKTDKPHQNPSFGKNTYSDSDAKAQAAWRQYAHSNKRSPRSRLKNAPRSIDGLEDPGSFASQAGQQKMPSSSAATPGATQTALNAAPQGGGSTGNTAPATQAPIANNLPAREAVPESTGEGAEEGVGEEGAEGSETGSEAEAGNNEVNDGPSQMAKANDIARAKDADGEEGEDKDMAESIEDKLPVKDPTKQLQDKAIELVLGKGNVGKLAKKILGNPMVRSALASMAPWCCGICGVIFLAFLMYTAFQSSFFGRLYLRFILPS